MEALGQRRTWGGQEVLITAARHFSRSICVVEPEGVSHYDSEGTLHQVCTVCERD